MSVIPARSLEDTELFARLKRLEDEKSCPPGLSGNVLAICNDAADRLKIFPAIHGQFTLHDETHCLRVVQIMAFVAVNVLDQLNAIEISLLILSAYFHDQGMVVEAGELDKIRSEDQWKIHEENWSVDHPNYGEGLAKLTDTLLAPEERARTMAIVGDLRAAMFTDFIRRTHGDRSARFIQSQYKHDPRLILGSQSITDLLARVCVSHVRPTETIIPAKGYQFDEFVGTTKVNVALLAYILRLADILDFDRERTPESLYRAIHFTSSISLLEWEKHRSVSGWEILPDRILFAAQCDHPAYERAIRDFFDVVDDELSALQSWSRSLPAEFQQYRLGLPLKVDRSRVAARVDPITNQAMYHYLDLEFSLSRNEIVKLLMTNGLYSNRSLFVRELLQNGLDALRHRQAIYLASSVPLSALEIRFEHFQESGFDIVRCRDNGVGMDEDIIRRFLTRAGRSYYRSPEFERERTGFREKGCDFDPCARFGIGFMSCFMFGDEITIRTRRDYGIGREHGKPIIVEIKGLSGIIVIRPGTFDQPVGTTIDVRGRRKSYTIDRWSDPVNLVEVLEGYALAVEFPIIGECRVPSIKGRIEIVPMITARTDPIEEIDIGSKSLFAIDLSIVDPHLRGEIKVCTLTDPSGIPVLANEEGALKIHRGPAPQSIKRRVISTADGREIDIDTMHELQQVCCDGILVAGKPGRKGQHMRLGGHYCQYGFGRAAFLIDARGDLKPNLTPARTPPDASGVREDPTWRRLFDVAGKAYSKLLEKIIRCCANSDDAGRFWSVADAYNLDLLHLRLMDVWNHLPFPITKDGERIEWLTAHSLGPIRLALTVDKKQPPSLSMGNGMALKIPNGLSSFYDENGFTTLLLFERLIMAMSSIVSVSPTEFELTLQEPQDEFRLADVTIRSNPDLRWLFQCQGNIESMVYVAGPHGFSNAKHPVIIRGREIAYKAWEERSPLECIISHLLWGNLDEPFDSDVPSNSWAARIRKQLGLFHRSINWDLIDPQLCPPYSIFRPGAGIDKMTMAHLERWADA